MPDNNDFDNNNLIDGLIASAQDGDKEAGLSILEMFANASSQGEIPDARIIKYIAEAFHDILDGTSAATALGIANPKHRPKSQPSGYYSITERNQDIAKKVTRLIKSGIKRGNATKQIAREYNIVQRIVEDAYDEWRDAAENVVNLENQDK